MRENIEDDIEEISIEMFNTALKEVWQKKREKYEFLVKGGSDMKNALFTLFRKVWAEETIPERWTKTTLLQLYKMKGDFQELKNLRNIHLKDSMAKLFSMMIVNVAKEILMKI